MKFLISITILFSTNVQAQSLTNRILPGDFPYLSEIKNCRMAIEGRPEQWVEISSFAQGEQQFVKVPLANKNSNDYTLKLDHVSLTVNFNGEVKKNNLEDCPGEYKRDMEFRFTKEKKTILFTAVVTESERDNYDPQTDSCVGGTWSESKTYKLVGSCPTLFNDSYERLKNEYFLSRIAYEPMEIAPDESLNCTYFVPGSSEAKMTILTNRYYPIQQSGEGKNVYQTLYLNNFSKAELSNAAVSRTKFEHVSEYNFSSSTLRSNHKVSLRKSPFGFFIFKADYTGKKRGEQICQTYNNGHRYCYYNWDSIAETAVGTCNLN